MEVGRHGCTIPKSMVMHGHSRQRVTEFEQLFDQAAVEQLALVNIRTIVHEGVHKTSRQPVI